MTAMDDLVPTNPRSPIGPGTTLNNTYMIDSLIGSGGMGDIYRGHAIHTGDAVAIKVIRTDLEANDAALALLGARHRLSITSTTRRSSAITAFPTIPS